MGNPKCPNHHVEMDSTNDITQWICPVSGARFEVEVEGKDFVKTKIKTVNGYMDVYKMKPVNGKEKNPKWYDDVKWKRKKS